MSGNNSMTGKSAVSTGPSLIERAAEIYDFNRLMRSADPFETPAVVPVSLAPQIEPAPVAEPVRAAVEPRPSLQATVAEVLSRPAAPRRTEGPVHAIDHVALAAEGYIDPKGAATSLSEEFRILKRQLLSKVFRSAGSAQDRLVLVNSAHPGDGKTWVAINLALSLSAESDLDVLLIESDFGKPSICSRLGLPAGAGLMDALVDPALDVASLILRTDIPSLSVLPAGRQVNNDTEVLASERTRAMLEGLVEGHPRRIILFDSPPALAASAASELASHVGHVLFVVRADKTSDVALRDAIQLLSGCPNIHAVLNGVKFSSSGRLFGAYYGKGK